MSRHYFDGSTIDGGLFHRVTEFARDTPWLHTPALILTNGLFLIDIIIFLYLGYKVYTAHSVQLRAYFMSVVASAISAIAVGLVIKHLVKEIRPCHSMSGQYILHNCHKIHDYAFPSDHSVIAGACAVAIWTLSWRLGIISALVAFLIGLTRVYIGAHYPHDVLAGWAIGVIVPLITILCLPKILSYSRLPGTISRKN